MTTYIHAFLLHMKDAFKHKHTYQWFVIAFAGFIARLDFFGVSSIIRILKLPARCYPLILNFFRSNAWSSCSLFIAWLQWVISEQIITVINQRIVLIADHTKVPKDGRRIPALTALHQDSESAGKPAFFRGHEWGCLAMLTGSGSKTFATPVDAEIHNDSKEGSRIERIISMAIRSLDRQERDAYLVLDAYFSVGSTFLHAKAAGQRLHILTRAKKNITAYIPPEPLAERRVGRPRIYGPKLTLMNLFHEWESQFLHDTMTVYGKRESVRYLVLDLKWKPIADMLRFFLLETPRGKIILMSSDLNMSVHTAIELYCHRSKIETLFDTVKNIFGGMKYHFWSKSIVPSSRRPQKGKQTIPKSTCPERYQNTQKAIEKFVALQLVVVGFLQILALKYPQQVLKKSLCWLRTSTCEIPSEFVTKMALSNLIFDNLSGLGDDLITHLIIQNRETIDKQSISENTT